MKDLVSNFLIMIKVSKIWIDIDEVLAHFLESYLNFYNNKYNSSFKRNDFFSYNFWEVVWWDKNKAIDDVHDFFETKHFELIQPIEWSQEAMMKLSKIYELNIITSRQSLIETKTIKWLDINFEWVFKEVHFWNHFWKDWERKTKSQICKDLWINLLIEDSIDYALDCANNNINVILFDSPWNQTNAKLPENIIRIKSWNEILEIFNL